MSTDSQWNVKTTDIGHGFIFLCRHRLVYLCCPSSSLGEMRQKTELPTTQRLLSDGKDKVKSGLIYTGFYYFVTVSTLL